MVQDEAAPAESAIPPVMVEETPTATDVFAPVQEVAASTEAGDTPQEAAALTEAQPVAMEVDGAV